MSGQNVRVNVRGQNVSDENPIPIAAAPDARTGKLASCTVTLSDTPGTVTTIALPDWARGVRLNAASACRFAFGENPAEDGTSSATTVATSAFAVGNTLPADVAEVRLLEEGESRDLRLMSETASVEVTIEVF